jgi:BrnA antitoxin of type II toxin-antitoxin system
MATRTRTQSPKRSDGNMTRSVTIRLPVRVLAHFKEAEPGYQTRIREALESHIERETRLESFERTCAKLGRLSLRDRNALSALTKRPFNSKAMRDPFDAISD